MAAILPEVHGDAVGAAQVGLDGGPHRIGLVGPPGLSHRRDVVYVHAELDHEPSPSRRCRSRTSARVASSWPLSEWLMRSRMSCLAWAMVAASSRRPRSRSSKV